MFQRSSGPSSASQALTSSTKSPGLGLPWEPEASAPPATFNHLGPLNSSSELGPTVLDKYTTASAQRSWCEWDPHGVDAAMAGGASWCEVHASVRVVVKSAPVEAVQTWKVPPPLRHIHIKDFSACGDTAGVPGGEGGLRGFLAHLQSVKNHFLTQL